MESYPYEAEERGSDYVRLASIAAGDQGHRLGGGTDSWMLGGLL